MTSLKGNFLRSFSAIFFSEHLLEDVKFTLGKVVKVLHAVGTDFCPGDDLRVIPVSSWCRVPEIS